MSQEPQPAKHKQGCLPRKKKSHLTLENLHAQAPHTVNIQRCSFELTCSPSFQKREVETVGRSSQPMGEESWKQMMANDCSLYLDSATL